MNRTRLLQGIAAALVLLLVVLTACFIRFSKSREDLAPKYTNAASQFITLENGAVAHIRDEGNRAGPVLVMLHGSNASLQTWEKWVSLLGDRFRLISMDLPGHGLTGSVPDKDYSLAAMEGFVQSVTGKLSAPRFALAGHAMGGAIATQYTADHPDQVMALILVDAGGIPTPGAKPRPGMVPGQNTPVIKLLSSWRNPRGSVDRIVHLAFADQAKVTDAMIDRYTDLLLYDGNRKATIKRAKDMPLGQLDVTASFAKIAVPTLILWGAQDRINPVARAEIFRAGIGKAQLITYPDSGHLPMEEAAEKSAADVRSFLETQASADAVAGSYGAKSADDGSGTSVVPALRGGKGAIEVAPLPGQ